MSLRGKRTARFDDGPVAKAKRRKMVGSVGGGGEEEEESQGWTPRPNADLKISTIYNRTSAEAPAELFRKDLISAMKLPDNEPLNSEKYWLISDTWKQEWERGVQVPVNPDSLPSPRVTTLTPHLPVYRQHNDFKLPKNKYVRITKDENFKPEEHLLSTIPAKADKTCSYDLDNCDIAWLRIVNGERALMGYMPIREELFERVVEELEIRCWDKVQTIVKNEERLGIEFDENVICDVCRSPDCEEGNEMVFCDNCNICVHQACYGITTIPSGSWLCRTCALGQRPECVLCPNRGGAMKSTRSGQKWAHVSCALWIPEVSIGCVENMEPITKIPSIPQSRWALICVLCRERVGACIQCSVKTCKTAYHVTCAFKHGLEMKAIIEDENAEDGVKLRSYCEKHSVSTRKDDTKKPGIINTDDDAKRRKRKDMSSEEKNQIRAEKLQEIEGEFEKHVSWTDLSHHHELDEEGLIYVYNYWVLKRRSRDNKPLIAPRTEDVDLLTRQQEQADQEKRMMFVQLRQDLERVRNLCYMVGRREKLARTFFRMREQTFHKQVAILGDNNTILSSAEITAIKEANHGPSIYDRLYSHPSAPDLSTDFETVLARIAGVTDEKGKVGELNGMRKRDNPYKKVYVNGGLDRRRALSSSGGLSASSGDERQRTVNKRLNKKKTRKPHTDTSTDDEKDPWKSRSKSLKQMEREMIGNSPTDDSDDLILLPRSGAKSGPVSNIYSDSDSPATSKSERPSVQKKKSISSAVRENKHDSDDYSRNRERDRDRPSKKNKDSVASSDLIVPQRQAAKKATESIRSTHNKPKEQTVEHEKVSSLDDNKNRTKPKPRLALSSRDIRPSSREERERPKKEEIKDDVYDFDPPSDGQDVLAYVPQREAAKKAAEHIKSGLQKPGQPEPPTDGSKGDIKLKKEDTPVSKEEQDDDKVQKTVKPSESKTRKISKSSVSSGSSSSSSCTSSSSSSSSESSSTSSSSSSSSESEEESKLKLKNHQEKKPEVIAEPDKKSSNKPVEKKHPSNTVRAGIASSRSEKVKVSERSSSSSSSSSSESEDNILKKPPLVKKSVFAPVNVKKTEVKITSLSHHKSNDSKETAIRKSRKTPDKKLKTSDGRPGLEFQLPPSEREKSPIRTEEKTKHKRSSEGNREAKARSPEHHGSRTSEAKAAVTTGSSSASDKKDLGRKRKSDDKVTSSTDANRHTSKSSHEERSRTQHSSFESKKADKKIDSFLSKKGFDSQSDSLNSILKREIAERREKVSRESLSKNSSKNSIDRIFEKRDKMVRERERKESEKDSDKNETPSKESSSRKVSSKSPKNSEHSHKNEVKSNKNQHRHKREESSESTPAKVSSVKFSPVKLTPVNSSPIKTSPSRSSPLTLSPVKLSPIPTEKKSLRSLFSPEPEFELLPQPKEELKVELPTPVPDDDNELPEVDCIELEEDKLKNSLKSDPNISLPILSPMHDLSDHVKSTVASIPNLEKADSGISRDFHVCDQESLGEPKKIGGRTTSLSVPYHGRSIFSPQPPSKDSAVELFEFEAELLEGVHADPAPLSFTFPQDFLFKSDSKEDDARETSNLVEKLRLEYAKKSQQEEASVPPTPQEPELPVPDLKEPELIAPSVPDEIKHDSSVITEEHKVLEAVMNSQPPIQEDPQPPPYQDAQFNFQQYPLLEKVPGRDKLDRSGANQADERWVPPSEEPPAQQEHWVQPEQPPPLENTQQERWIEPTNRPGEQQDNRWMGIAGERWVAPESERRPQDRWAPDRPEEPRWAQPGASERGGQTEERWVPPSSYHVQSPYINKWAESELMPSRHSETSSASSTDHEPEPPPPPPPPPTQQAQASVPELIPFNTGPPLSYPSCALAAQENWPDPSGQPYPSMLPPYSQPFPAPSFPHGFAPSFSAMVPEPPEDALHMPPPACTAAFTSSQHNMALTAAMVTPDQPPLTPLPFPPEPCITQQEPRQTGIPPTPVLPERPDISPITKKSPMKQQPTRTSTRISTKSPAKSPGISPRQSEGSGRGRGGGKRGRPPGSRNATRGGGRGSRGGRGRGRVSHQDNTIHSKLIGTVYDFDFDQEEEGESLGDLRSMRERRKSSDRRVEGSPGEILPPRPVVQPLMPGPVDMRTYSSFEPPPAHHFDDFEDEPRPPPSPPPPAPVQQDSRNQLKVKIKGPFLDANYSAAAPQSSVPAPVGSLPAPPDPSTGSNLRRMRKKELLRQYCAQDMNKDYPPVPQDPAPSRNVITIPKAVASMTSIPTRDDYKAVVDMAASMEKKRRKSGHSPVEDIVEEPSSDRRRSLPGISVEEVPTRKKGRGRQRLTTPPAPKLKIKIGGNEVSVGEPPTLRIRPPKKRISSVPPSSLEVMKMQSMKFREEVMAQFDSAEKPPPRKEKRKKREAQVEIISANEAKLPRLVIRLGGRPIGEKKEKEKEEEEEEEEACSPIRNHDPPEKPNKPIPIRLTLARCTEGTYVMKEPSSPPPPPPSNASATSPVR